MNPTNLRNALNGVTLFGHAETGTIHNSAADESNDPAWVAAVAEAKKQGYSGHAVWAVAQTIFQKGDGAVKNTDSEPTLPQEQPDNGGMMNMAILNTGTPEGAHKGWETRKGGDSEHGEEQHSSGHDFNWMKSRGTGEKGEVYGTLLHRGKAIDGSSGWYRTHDPKEAAQRAMDAHGVKKTGLASGMNEPTYKEARLGKPYSDGFKPASPEKLTEDEHRRNISDRLSNSAGKSVLTHGLEPLLNTWSDAAGEASAEARHNVGARVFGHPFNYPGQGRGTVTGITPDGKAEVGWDSFAGKDVKEHSELAPSKGEPHEVLHAATRGGKHEISVEHDPDKDEYNVREKTGGHFTGSFGSHDRSAIGSALSKRFADSSKYDSINYKVDKDEHGLMK